MTTSTRALFLALLLILLALVSPVAADSGPLPTPDAAQEEELTTPQALEGDTAYLLDVTYNTFLSENGFQGIAGRQLVDIEVRWDGANEWYSAIWAPVSGTIHTLFQGSYSDWEAFFTANNSRNGRYLDVEVGYFGNNKLYSAIFLEDGDRYSRALHTTNTDGQFQDRLAQYQNSGMALIDFEAYQTPGGATRFAGIWVDDPNQPVTVLYYGLESPDVGDLITPRHGRVIDIERYYSDLHGEDRWALLFAMFSGGEQFQRRNDSAANISYFDGIFSDADTHLIDIEAYVLSSNNRYSALWGDTFKTLHEVPAIQGDLDPEPLSTTLGNLLANFEANNQGVIGLYAKNLRTNQSLAYRSYEPFYLASTAKIPIHIKYWREVQNGHLNGNTSLAYTGGSNSASPWYTGNRNDAGASRPALGVADFGSSFTLQQYDSMMMDISDNAATSILMDHPDVGLTLDGYDVNEWLADIAGVGQGWGPVTSIQDVDRAIMWQGQQTATDAGDDSFFLAPPSGLESLFRWGTWDCDGSGGANFSGDADCWNELRTYYGVSTVGALPDYSSFTGHRRYYNMGLNTATPRATALLLEELAEGRLLDATNTNNAITSMTEPTPFGWYGTNSFWPGYINIWAKGGVKGFIDNANNRTVRAVSDAAIIDNGQDDIVLAVLTEDNFRPTTTNPGNNGVRDGFTDPIADEVLRLLTPDLASCTAALASSTATAGETFQILCELPNDGGGDALNFDVNFYASTNTTISTSDYYLGSVTVNEVAGFGSEVINLAISFPDNIPPGDYYPGWIVDPGGSANGDVGELSETNNTGFLDFRFTVTLPPPDLGITALSTTDAQLTWGSTTLTVCDYDLYESAAPYTMPPSPAVYAISFPHTLPGRLGDAATNYYYLVRIDCNGQYTDSAWVGAFDFALVPGN